MGNYTRDKTKKGSKSRCPCLLVALPGQQPRPSLPGLSSRRQRVGRVSGRIGPLAPLVGLHQPRIALVFSHEPSLCPCKVVVGRLPERSAYRTRLKTTTTELRPRPSGHVLVSFSHPCLPARASKRPPMGGCNAYRHWSRHWFNFVAIMVQFVRTVPAMRDQMNPLILPDQPQNKPLNTTLQRGMLTKRRRHRPSCCRTTSGKRYGTPTAHMQNGTIRLLRRS